MTTRSLAVRSRPRHTPSITLHATEILLTFFFCFRAAPHLLGCLCEVAKAGPAARLPAPGRARQDGRRAVPELHAGQGAGGDSEGASAAVSGAGQVQRQGMRSSFRGESRWHPPC